VTARVIDVGAGHEPDPRATETADLHAVGADHQFDIRDEWPFETASVDGLVLSHVLEHVREQAAVLREAARCVVDDGWLEVTVPVGADAHADPDHERAWTYATPELFAADGRTRHWDDPLPLRLVNHKANVWLFPPFSRLSPLLQALADRWPAEAVRRCSAGEIVATYRRVAR